MERVPSQIHDMGLGHGAIAAAATGAVPSQVHYSCPSPGQRRHNDNHTSVSGTSNKDTCIYPQEHLLHKGHFSNKDTLAFPKDSSCIKDTSLTSTLFGTSLTGTLFCVWIRGARK